MKFKTTDKGLVAYLLMQDVTFDGQETDGRFLYFTFSPIEKCEELKLKYELSEYQNYFEKIRLVTRWVSDWRQKNFTKPNGYSEKGVYK